MLGGIPSSLLPGPCPHAWVSNHVHIISFTPTPGSWKTPREGPRTLPWVRVINRAPAGIDFSLSISTLIALLIFSSSCHQTQKLFIAPLPPMLNRKLRKDPAPPLLLSLIKGILSSHGFIILVPPFIPSVTIHLCSGSLPFSLPLGGCLSHSLWTFVLHQIPPSQFQMQVDYPVSKMLGTRSISDF